MKRSQEIKFCRSNAKLRQHDDPVAKLSFENMLGDALVGEHKRTVGVTDGPFVDMSLGLIRSTLP